MSVVKVVHLNSQMGVADAVPSHHSISALGRLRSGAQYEWLDGACWVTLLLTVLGPRGSLRQLPELRISLDWISYLKRSPVREAGPKKMGHPLANRSESTRKRASIIKVVLLKSLHNVHVRVSNDHSLL